MPYDDEEELLGLINHSPYGLGTSLWTNNLAAAMPRWGFSDVSQFSRAFRREYDMSPKAWREQYQPSRSAP